MRQHLVVFAVIHDRPHSQVPDFGILRKKVAWETQKIDMQY